MAKHIIGYSIITAMFIYFLFGDAENLQWARYDFATEAFCTMFLEVFQNTSKSGRVVFFDMIDGHKTFSQEVAENLAKMLSLDSHETPTAFRWRPEYDIALIDAAHATGGRPMQVTGTIPAIYFYYGTNVGVY